MMMTRRRRMMSVMTLVIGAGLAVSASAAMQPSGDAAPAPAPVPAQPFKVTTNAVNVAVRPAVIASADDLLTALESAGADLRTMQADLRWTKQFGEIAGGDEKQIKTGTLYFESRAGVTPATGAASARPTRRFQVDFTTETIDNSQQNKRSSFIFDGSLFVERQPDEKQVFRRQVVPPGESIDPLAVGEGPFPIPIGQQRVKILERFEATLVPAGEDFPGGQAPPALRETYQLKLKPKPGTDEAKQFLSVRIWYRTDDLLPRMARTADRDESVTEVFLTNVRVNQALPEGVFDTSRPPGWQGDDQEYQREAAESPAPTADR